MSTLTLAALREMADKLGEYVTQVTMHQETFDWLKNRIPMDGVPTVGVQLAGLPVRLSAFMPVGMSLLRYNTGRSELLAFEDYPGGIKCPTP